MNGSDQRRTAIETIENTAGSGDCFLAAVGRWRHNGSARGLQPTDAVSSFGRIDLILRRLLHCGTLVMKRLFPAILVLAACPLAIEAQTEMPLGATQSLAIYWTNFDTGSIGRAHLDGRYARP
jgi:hypothetical protein